MSAAMAAELAGVSELEIIRMIMDGKLEGPDIPAWADKVEYDDTVPNMRAHRSSTIPCVAHPDDYEHSPKDTTLRCSRCKTIRFHERCYAVAGPKHRPFCDWIVGHPEALKFLRQVYNHLGVWTPDGNRFCAMPMNLTEKAVASVRSWEKLASGRSPEEAPVCPVSKRDWWQSRLPPVATHTSALTQRGVVFHATGLWTAWYLMSPGYARSLVEQVTARGVKEWIDPIAGSAFVPAMLVYFGGLSPDQIVASDRRVAGTFWPTAKADALNPETYLLPNGAPRDWETTVVILSWPDYQGSDPLSPKLLRMLAELGVIWIVLCAGGCPGMAIHEEGEEVLLEMYHEEPLVDMPDFVVENYPDDEIVALSPAASRTYMQFTLKNPKHAWARSALQTVRLYRRNSLKEFE